MFAADLPAEFTATAAVSQRPIAARALNEPLAVELDASHAVAVSRPDEVASLILAAVDSVA